MDSSQIINKEDIVEISASNFNASNFNKMQSTSPKKILLLTGLGSIEEASSMVLQLDSDFLPLIITIHILGVLSGVLEKLKVLNNHIKGNAIIQISNESLAHHVFIKEAFGTLSRINIINAFDEEKAEKSVFGFQIILNLLRLRCGGLYDLFLREIRLDTSYFFKMKTFFEHALENENQICLEFLSIFGFKNEQQSSLFYWRNNDGSNLLTNAIRKKTPKFVKFLLQHNVDINFEDNGETASDIAYDRGYRNMLKELLKADAPFPKKPGRNHKQDLRQDRIDFEELISNRERIHQHIFEENLQEIRNYVRDKPEVKFCYRYCKCDKTSYETFMRDCKCYEQSKHTNVSLVTTALRERKFHIYSFLVTNGFSHGCDVHFFDTITTHYQNQDSITEEIQKLPIHQLLCQSKFAGKPSRDNCIKALEMSKNLQSIREINPLVAIFSSLSQAKIEYDFNHPTIQGLSADHPNWEGLTDSINKIVLIGADGEPNKVSGVVGHELCHIAMQHIYLNNCKPYRTTDTKDADDTKEIEFNKVSKTTSQIESRTDTEDIVKVVFMEHIYPSDKRAAELIVRVPNLLAHYKYEYDKLIQLKEDYKDLFTFYSVHTLKDLEAECELLKNSRWFKTSHVRELIPEHINRFYCSDEEFNFPVGITSIVCEDPSVALFKAYQSLFHHQSTGPTPVFFVKLESLIVEEIQNDICQNMLKNIWKEMECYNSATLVAVQSDLNQKTYTISNNVKENLDKLENSTIIFISKENAIFPELTFGATERCFNSKFSALTLEFQSHILEREVYFHGEPIVLKELLEVGSPELAQLTLSEVLVHKTASVNELNSIEQKFVNPLQWIAHVNLVELQTNRSEEEWKNMEPLEYVANLSSEILKISSNLDKSIFATLYRKQRFLLMYSGFNSIDHQKKREVDAFLSRFTGEKRNIDESQYVGGSGVAKRRRIK